MTAEERDAAAPRVLVFFDYACPFCYLDQFRVLRLAEEHHADVILVPFELRPGIPPEGISAAEHGLTHSEKVDAHLRRLAEEAGIPFEVGDRVPRTHLAMAMGEVARDASPEAHWRVHLGIFDAHFGQGLDIGDEAVLLGVAERAGLDPALVTEAWERGTYEERLEAFRHVVAELGVTATPAVLVCDTLVIGSRPYRVLEDALEACEQPGRAEPAETSSATS